MANYNGPASTSLRTPLTTGEFIFVTLVRFAGGDDSITLPCEKNMCRTV